MGVNTKRFDSASDMITFSRASGAYGFTRVGYGSELVSNGTFDTDTTGSTPNTWETSSANASLIKQADGTALFTSASFAYARISNENRPVLPVGVYWVSFEISETQGSLSNVHVGIGAVGNTISGDGTYGYAYVSSSEQAYELQIRPNSGGTGSFKIDNISVKEVLYNSSDPSATLKLIYHPNDIPRIEYNVDGSAKGILIEEARTNISSNSLSFPANAGCSDAPSTETAPDGSTNATLVTASGNGLHRVRAGSNTTFTHTGVAYAISTFVKNVDADYVQILNGGDANYFANFDLVNGTVGTTGSATTATITEYSNGWFRIAALFDGTGHLSHNGTYIYISPNASAGYAPHANNPGSQMHLWGFQTEAGTFPTSYIETLGSTAARALDEASIGVGEFGHNKTAGALLVETSAYEGSPFLLVLSSGSDTNRAQIRASASNISGYVQSTGDSGSFLAVSGAPIVPFKTSMGFKTDDIGLTVNGGPVSTDTSQNIPVSITKLNIGSSAINQVSGKIHIKSITYYPRRLTDAQIQELTT